MSELKLKPDFEMSGDNDTLRGPAALNRLHADGLTRGSAALRSSRRRIDAARLRTPSDDGYHLFRVY